MGRNEDIKVVLEDLLKMEDVQACLLAGSHTGTITPTGNVKLKNLTLWKLIMDTTYKFFSIANDFFRYGLRELNFELGEYNIIMSFIDPSTALITVVPNLANMGIIGVEIENTKRDIEKIISVKA